MRLLPRFIIPLVILLLVISFQNFSNVNSSEWDDGHTLKIIREMSEFDKNNPNKPTLAVPQSGSDLKSVTGDWMDRQGHIFLNGYDKKLEDAMNEKLNSWVEKITRKDPADEKSSQPDPNGPAGTSSSQSGASSSTNKKFKQSIHFSRVNSLKYDVGDIGSFNLTADPGNTHVDFSKSISSNSKLGVEHRGSDKQTQMIFKYEW